MHAPLRVLVGSLGPGLLPDAAVVEPPRGTILLDLGPDHPSRAGLLELRGWTDDGLITSAEVVVGAMHRGAEKLSEVRGYRQILMLADRHDWQAPFFGELAVALTCEQMLGLEVPARAVWLRTLLAEHTRILSHLGFLGYTAFSLGHSDRCFEVREELRHSTYVLTGNRIHPMANRLVGLAVDTDAAWLDAELTVMDAVGRVLSEVTALIDCATFGDLAAGGGSALPGPDRGVRRERPRGPGQWGALDLRRRDPYLAYAPLADLLVDPPDITGDARSRFRALLHDVAVSASLVRACADQLRSVAGPVSVRVQKVVKLPEGELYRAVEAPLGLAACTWCRGERRPRSG